MLKLKGFPDAWCDIIMKTVIVGKVGIKVNNSIGPYFAKIHNLIKTLVPELVDSGLVLLQCADDTLFFIEDDVARAQNLKFLLCSFG
jgi:hypothetical protein